MKVVQVTAQCNLFCQLFVLLSEENNFGTVPWTLVAPDSEDRRKKLMRQLEDDIERIIIVIVDVLRTYIVDGNALLHLLAALPTYIWRVIRENIYLVFCPK